MSGAASFRHPDEAMAGNVHRLGETFRRAIEEPSLKIFFGRECDRVEENVEPPPLFPDLVEHRLQLSRDRDVELACDRRIKPTSERFDPPSPLFVQPGNSEVCAD
jgi:hypothetical protein